MRDADALRDLADANNWPAPTRVTTAPRANQFPVLVHHAELGWRTAQNYQSAGVVQLVGGETVAWDEVADDAYTLELPGSGGLADGDTALTIFRRAFLKRKPMIVTAIIATIVINIFAVVTSLYSMQVYDRVIPRGSYPTLFVLTAGVIFALILDFLMRSARSLLVEREAARIDLEVSEFFFARMQAVRLDHRPPGVGTMASQLRGLEQIRSLMSFGSLFVVADLPFAALFIALVWWIAGFQVALVPMIIFPISLLCAYILARTIRKRSDAAQVTGNRKNGVLVETFDAAETLKAGHGRWHMAARWSRLVDEVLAQEDGVKRWAAIATALFGGLSQLAYVLIVAVGAMRAAENEITIGALIACSILAGRINGPLIGQLPGLIVQMSYARSSLNMLNGILALPVEREGAAGVRPGTLDGPVALSHCRFAYPGGTPAIDIEQIAIDPGETVAVLGGIGSGKSTFLRLLAGLYAPTQGQATLGGLDMSLIADDQLRRHIGYLPQDYRLIDGTLRENLTLGLPEPGDQKVIAAAKKTGLIHLISDHPMGLDLPIHEGGSGLSGGQRTLTGLTRMMLMKPRLWLLDEPTAHLDQTTEANVLNALKARMDADSAFVMVTHRLALLPLVERVIVLAKGRVWLDGRRDQVLGQLKDAAAKQQRAVPKPAPRIAS
ncbi:MAG: ATP-binding cassette domain-containing protein [Pacificimonas sp.]